MINYEKLLYTYKHRKVVLFLAKLYYNDEKLIEQLEKHDMDKLFLMLFYDKKDIENYHRSVSSHHDNDLDKNELDYIEMVLDWESARYTKKDKPLNAYDTLNKFYPKLIDKILPILKKAGLDHPTSGNDERVVEYVKTLENDSIDDIRNELIDYINKVLPKEKKSNNATKKLKRSKKNE